MIAMSDCSIFVRRGPISRCLFLILALLRYQSSGNSMGIGWIPFIPHACAFTTSPSVVKLSRKVALGSQKVSHRGFSAFTTKGPRAKQQPSFSSAGSLPRRHVESPYSSPLASSSSSSEETNKSSPPKTSLPSKISSLFVYCLSGRREEIQMQRPNYSLNWIPTWLLTLRPITQCAFCFVLYVFHLSYLTQNSIPFPIQLLPNNKGHFQSIGLDSIAGIATLVLYRIVRRQYEAKVAKAEKTQSEPKVSTQVKTDEKTNTTITTVSSSSTATNNFSPSSHVYPKLIETPHVKQMPWKKIYQSKYSRFTSLLAFMGLIQGYLWTGRWSMFWEDTLYSLANYYPMTIAMHRSLSVLLGHLSWVAIGFAILSLIPRPQPFSTKWYKRRFASSPAASIEALTTTTESNETNGSPLPSKQRHPQWLWWTIGGYFVSSWFFNIADFINQCILPVEVLEQASQSVVSQLVQPEHNDFLASLIGYLAPCISAPWWEEVLYRGFLLPALILQNMPYQWSILVSSIIFSLHHVSTTSYIPLCVLGYTWNVIYTKSKNLQTTILIHAMWNSRVFIGSWLGL